jgi:hypothetical protein
VPVQWPRPGGSRRAGAAPAYRQSQLKTVIPHHIRLQPPPGAHNAADVEAAFTASGLPIKVIKPEFNKVYQLKG